MNGSPIRAAIDPPLWGEWTLGKFVGCVSNFHSHGEVFRDRDEDGPFGSWLLMDEIRGGVWVVTRAEGAEDAGGRKRINHRQWFHRLIHRKCWNCNVPLEYVQTADGRRCPMCLTFYGETAMVANEQKVRSRWWQSPWRSV